MAATPWRFGLILFGVGASSSLFGAAAAGPQFPALTGRVVDDANLLSPADRDELTADLKALEDKSSDQVVVVTLPSLQGYAIEDYGYQLGRHWGIGTEKLNNGVLLIVAPNERKVRIEVGRGLEPMLTDALSKVIIETSILPRFRSGDFPGGIKYGVRDITTVLTGDKEELEQRARAQAGRQQSPDRLDSGGVLDPADPVAGVELLADDASRLPRRAPLGPGLLAWPRMGWRLGRRRRLERRLWRRRLLRWRGRLRWRRRLGRVVGMAMTPFTLEEQDSIAAAIGAAEAKNQRRDRGRRRQCQWGLLHLRAGVGGGRRVLVPWPLIAFTAWPVEYIYLAQLTVFAVGAVLSQWDALRLAIVPKVIKRSRAHRKAVEQFLAQNLHTTRGRTGVLIYVSFAERYAEVIADDGIYRKVPQAVWVDVVDTLTGHLGRGAPAGDSSPPSRPAATFSPRIFPRGRRPERASQSSDHARCQLDPVKTRPRPARWR